LLKDLISVYTSLDKFNSIPVLTNWSRFTVLDRFLSQKTHIGCASNWSDFLLWCESTLLC